MASEAEGGTLAHSIPDFVTQTLLLEVLGKERKVYEGILKCMSVVYGISLLPETISCL